MTAVASSTNTSTSPSARPAPFTIQTLEESDDYLKLFFYGPFGAGKTRLAGTAQDAPGMRDVFYIDAESGRKTLRENWPDLNVVVISQYSQIARIYEFLRAHCFYRDEGNEAKLLEIENKFRGASPVTQPHRFKTVVIDSLSEVQAYLLYQLLGIRIGEQKLDETIAKSGFDEYDQLLQGMRLLVRSFRDLPMHVILVSGEMTKEDERKRQLKIPNFTGKLTHELPGFFDVVGYYQAAEPDEKGVVHRRLNLQRRQTFDAKSRLSRIQVPYLDDPTMETLMTAAGLA